MQNFECKICLIMITNMITGKVKMMIMITNTITQNMCSIYHVYMMYCISLCLSIRLVTIMAYGQTGSGKSYTMMGDKGIVPQSIKEMFELLEKVLKYMYM